MKTEQLLPYFINKSNTVVEALQKIDLNSKQILFVVDSNRKLEGIITDGDIRRWLLKTGELQGTVSEFMNTAPKVIYRKDVKSAVKFMKNAKITALPVITSKGIVSDIIFRDDIDKIEENFKCLTHITRIYCIEHKLPYKSLP